MAPIEIRTYDSTQAAISIVKATLILNYCPGALADLA